MLAMQPRNHPNRRKKKGVDDAVDDRETPDDLFQELDAEFHFTLDAAANHHNAKCGLYATRKGLYANIAGRAVPVHEEDEVGGGLPDLDWGQAAEGIWHLYPPSEARETPLARPSHYLRLGNRRYTAWDDGLPRVRHPELCEPQPSLPWNGLGQYEGLFPKGETGWAFYARPPANDTLEGETGGRRTGLDVSWAGHTIFINPPFSDIAPWVAKASEETGTAVMLLPANRTEQPWWQDCIEPFRDAQRILDDDPQVRFLRRRRAFLHRGKQIGNRTSKNPPFGICIVIWDRRATWRKR